MADLTEDLREGLVSKAPVAYGSQIEHVPEFKVLQEHVSPMRLVWNNLRYVVDSGKKVILDDVNGNLQSGELCCIMGPSGAGKTTLMNILAGRIATGGGKEVLGEISVNDKTPQDMDFRNQLAYVMQEDALFATSTPRECLRFSARLRLPRDVSFREQDEMIEDIIESLGLVKCADTMVGSKMIKGISGGEKKRTAIGVELITNPSILFLDEPTSGLDSYAAYNVTLILKALAKAGCAILCTIHQPSSEIFHLFQRTILISAGRIVYDGKNVEMTEYFTQVYGKKCPNNYNPADFVMFLMQLEPIDNFMNKKTKWDEAKVLQVRESFGSTINILRQSSHVSAIDSSARTTWGLCTQLAYLADREFKNLYRDKASLIARFGVTLFLNLLYSLIFFQAGDWDSGKHSLQTHFGALTQLVISSMFGSSQPMILTFPQERPIFLREYATGTYGAFAYFFSKLMVELPLALVQSAVALTPAFFLMGLDGFYVYLLMIMWGLALVSSSTALLLGCIATNTQTAMQAAPMIFVPQLLFTGFFIRMSQIPEALRWVQYICSLKFAINLVLIVEFDGGRDEEKELLTQNDTDPDLWYVYLGILIALFVGVRMLALLFLRAKARSFE